MLRLKNSLVCLVPKHSLRSGFNRGRSHMGSWCRVVILEHWVIQDDPCNNALRSHTAPMLADLARGGTMWQHEQQLCWWSRQAPL
jgi:hypothetical protein